MHSLYVLAVAINSYLNCSYLTWHTALFLSVCDVCSLPPQILGLAVIVTKNICGVWHCVCVYARIRLSSLPRACIGNFDADRMTIRNTYMSTRAPHKLTQTQKIRYNNKTAVLRFLCVCEPCINDGLRNAHESRQSTSYYRTGKSVHCLECFFFNPAVCI